MLMYGKPGKYVFFVCSAKGIGNFIVPDFINNDCSIYEKNNPQMLNRTKNCSK